MKRGFTLVELLAVITILSIILLITVPIVSGIIKDSKEKTREQSVELYGRAIENAISEYFVKYPLEDSVTLEQLETEKLINYKGSKIECNIVQIEGRDVYLEDCKVGNKHVEKTYGKPLLTLEREDYRGYYADVDGDGEADGVIYADLAHPSRENAKWGPGYNNQYINNGEYSYEALEDLKEYTISENKYTEGKFGEKEIITLKPGSSGNSRFYVMALNDFTTEAYTDPNDSNNNYPAYTTYYWYYGAFGNMSPLITENEFSKGKENTRKMIAKWKAAGTTEGYSDSPQNNRDIWKHIEGKYQEGWYIPSGGEWAAFADYFGITSDCDTGSCVANSGNYNSTYGLSGYYWSSSQDDASGAWGVYFFGGNMLDYFVDTTLYVRLGATF